MSSSRVRKEYAPPSNSAAAVPSARVSEQVREQVKVLMQKAIELASKKPEKAAKVLEQWLSTPAKKPRRG